MLNFCWMLVKINKYIFCRLSLEIFKIVFLDFFGWYVEYFCWWGKK